MWSTRSVMRLTLRSNEAERCVFVGRVDEEEEGDYLLLRLAPAGFQRYVS